jgi:hypothetical protein
MNDSRSLVPIRNSPSLQIEEVAIEHLKRKPHRELDTRTGKVSLPTHLPPPSPLRTLQENVFARASALFERAKQGSKTQIQELLEADVGKLRDAYAEVIQSGVP